MKPRALIAGLVFTAAVAYGVTHLMSYGPVLATNRARWLMNQSRWEEAREQLERVRRSAPAYQRADRLHALVLLNSGRPEEAAAELSRMENSTWREFLSGASAYMLNREEEARGYFARAVGGGANELEPWMADVARMGAAQNDFSGVVNPPPVDGKASPLEKILRNAYHGRALYTAGRLAESRQYFERAWSARDRNWRSYLMGTVATTLDGDFPRAHLHVDRSTSRSEFLRALDSEIGRLYGAQGAMASTVRQQLTADERRLRLQRSKAWVENLLADPRRGTEAVETSVAVEQLLESAPHDTLGTLLLAEALERAGELGKAYSLYREAFSRSPAYPVLLRMRDLAGNPGDLRRQEAEFLQGPQVVAYIPAEAMQTSQTLTRQGHLALLEQSSAVAEFSVPSDGEYQIALVASSDRAFNLGPLALLVLDGQRVGDIYIAREGWDVYSHLESLNSGAHRLEVRYINDLERRPTSAEDRNLYLQGVLVTRAGGE